jgi:ABC-type Zn2+ transport system substrate-binding protein/surface adhesin
LRETGSVAGAVGEEEEENDDEEDDEEDEENEEDEEDEEDEEEEDEKAEEEEDKEDIREAVEEEGWLRVAGALRLSSICVNQMLVRSVSLSRLTLIFLALN